MLSKVEDGGMGMWLIFASAGTTKRLARSKVWQKGTAASEVSDVGADAPRSGRAVLTISWESRITTQRKQGRSFSHYVLQISSTHLFHQPDPTAHISKQSSSYLHRSVLSAFRGPSHLIHQATPLPTARLRLRCAPCALGICLPLQNIVVMRPKSL